MVTDLFLAAISVPCRYLCLKVLMRSGSSLDERCRAPVKETTILPVYRTREPGGTPLGDEIRNLILRKEGQPPTPRTESASSRGQPGSSTSIEAIRRRSETGRVGA